MPTRVSPDDPNATGAARLQSMVGGRSPGDPSMAGKPGVQAGRVSFPAPPSPATSMPGRPPTPAPTPAGGRAAMSQPGTPAPGVGPSSAASGVPPASAAPSSPTPGSPTPAPGAGSSAATAPPQPTLDAQGMATQPMASPTIPPPGSLVPGASAQTPYGVASTGADGSQRLALDAAGQQRYKESMAALRAKFATPRVMRGMTGLPDMDLKLGASNFDPFSGRFLGKD